MSVKLRQQISLEVSLVRPRPPLYIIFRVTHICPTQKYTTKILDSEYIISYTITLSSSIIIFFSSLLPPLVSDQLKYILRTKQIEGALEQLRVRAKVLLILRKVFLGIFFSEVYAATKEYNKASEN